ncbi:hypothetical protein [Polluticoccus soli]|uniref:hypothetical protein n=1 Tax=Polluticoccus soli TaxID=3034150 RepID=UPI0023E24A1C|nr:hypothetical protein [Flavipsychrobacter sp. JY13-12]
MKQILLYITLCCLSTMLLAQAPKKFNYQGIARNNNGTPLANQALGIRLSIINDSANGALRYRETHTVTTNGYGLYNLSVGGGTPDSNTMDSVVWAAGDKWMLVEIDPAGGSNYIAIGTSQLLSVPYALYSENSGSQGPPGSMGVMTVATFNGPIGSIASGPGFAFVGPTTILTLSPGYLRMIGSANAALGLASGSPITISTSLCYQQNGGPITNFNTGGYLVSQVSTLLTVVPASATVVLAPGTYTVGYCIANNSGVAVNNNDFVSGWILVTQ